MSRLLRTRRCLWDTIYYRVSIEDAITEAVRKFDITAEDYTLTARHQNQMVDPEGRLKAESEQGTEPGHEYPLPGDEELMAAYEQLVVGRRVTTRIRRSSGRAGWLSTRPATGRSNLGFAAQTDRGLMVPSARSH